MDISHNRILNNGLRTNNQNINGRRGSRGGIVIRKSMASLKMIPLEESRGMTNDQIPALVVHCNIVHQPLGQALSAVYTGAVSITNNEFCTEGVDFRDQDAIIAGAVFLMGMGVSRDIVKFHILPALKKTVKEYSGQADTPGSAKAVAFNETVEEAKAMIEGFTWLLSHFPASPVQFADNQTVLDVQRSQDVITVTAQFLFSLDDITFNDNYASCIVAGEQPRAQNQVVSNTFLWGLAIRSNGNRFLEDISMEKRGSLFSYAHMNTALGNQATNCIYVLGEKLPGDNLLQSSNLVLRAGPEGSMCKEQPEIEIPIWDKGPYVETQPPILKSTTAGNMEMQSSCFIPDTLKEFMEVLEKRRKYEIQEAKAFLASQLQVQTRELERLTRKYGNDHPRVQAVDVRLAYLRRLQDSSPVAEPEAPVARAGTFAIFQGADAQYYFHLRAANGEIILQSEGYRTLRSAQNGVETVRKNAVPDRFEERETESGAPYFVLKAGNNQVIGRSEVYTSLAAMREGIQAVIRDASTAEVEKRAE